MSWTFSFLMLGFFLLSGALLCGVVGWAASRALAATGALDAMPAGREHAARLRAAEGRAAPTGRAGSGPGSGSGSGSGNTARDDVRA